MSQFPENPFARATGEPEPRQVVSAACGTKKSAVPAAHPRDWDAVNGEDLASGAVAQNVTQTPWGIRIAYWPGGMDPSKPATPVVVIYSPPPPVTTNGSMAEEPQPDARWTFWWLAAACIWALVFLVSCRGV